MQTTSLAFRQHAAGYMRPVSWQLRASFDKAFSSSVDFFTLDTSLLDGPDVLQPEDSNVVQEWDKYEYVDYSDRVISMEVTREELEPYSIVQSFADITLNNYDNYFTPNSGSPIDSYILPRRPMRILMGFGGETVPVFVGLSDRIPEINKSEGTARFHLIDFLTFVLEKEISETVMLQDASTGDILDYLFQAIGLLPAQYDLDATSFNRVPFFFVEKGTKLGDIIRDLMRAEQGRLWLDELGVIRFLNRQNYPTTSVYNFSKANTIDYETSDEDDVINYVKIEAEVLEVQNSQSVWELSIPLLVKAGSTAETIASLYDPATSVTTPTYSAEPVFASHFITHRDPEGTIPNNDIALDTIDVFAKAVKLVFENTGSTDAYVTSIDLWGTPVKVADTIIVEDQNQASIDNLELRPYEFKTQFIQKVSSAISKAAVIIDDYKDYGSIVELEVKGTPALQIGDLINLDLDGYQGDHATTKDVMILAGNQFRQRLTAKQRDRRTYFILDSSELDGTDVLV